MPRRRARQLSPEDQALEAAARREMDAAAREGPEQTQPDPTVWEAAADDAGRIIGERRRRGRWDLAFPISPTNPRGIPTISEVNTDALSEAVRSQFGERGVITVPASEVNLIAGQPVYDALTEAGQRRRRGQRAADELTPLPGELFPGPYTRSAVISECGTYRYLLTREWGEQTPQSRSALFIMLNPSTADGSVDDPTIRRCVEFAKEWGHSRMDVVNLFAYRATDPAVLDTYDGGIIGPENGDFIMDAIDASQTIIVAWGVTKSERVKQRAGTVCHMLARMGRDAQCLGTTKEGYPRHPLYVKGDTLLEPFKVPVLLD